MKVINAIVKILVVLAAIAGAVYVAATYGDKIVAWCKKMLGCTCCCECDCDCDCDCEEGECCCEAPVVEEAPVAAETDFEG